MTAAAAIRHVMVGVDFDDPSASAVAVAGALAAALDARLTLVHAASIEMPPYFTGAQQHALDAERRATLVRIADELRAFAAARTPTPFATAVEEGAPAATLRQHARVADLLVLGTHRYTGARRWWLGSVAEEVVRTSAVPVLVVPAHDDAAAAVTGGATIALHGRAADVAPWVEIFERVLGMTVIRAERERAADVLEACTHPVLFVPERSVP